MLNRDTELENKIFAFLRNELKRFKRILNPDYIEKSEHKDDDDESDAREGALKMALHFLRTMDQKELVEKLQENEKDVVCRTELKKSLQSRYRSVFEGIQMQGDSALLEKIYTEVYITEGESRKVNEEHEIRQIEMKSKLSAGQETPIKCSDIFKLLPGQDKPIRRVITKGVAGIGKTVSVQKYILDWAEGKENQDIHFIFPLPFRELNLIREKQYSMMALLHHLFSEIKPLTFQSQNKRKVLFILDGLDECRPQLNFQKSHSLTDVTEVSSVDMLLTNLITGHLFPTALLWITSRPAAANQIPPMCVDRVTEVQGFSDAQKEEYFRKRISDQNVAKRVISHLRSSRSLYIMCHIPVFCWIAATVLQLVFAGGEKVPKTLTEMYTYFLVFQNRQRGLKFDNVYDEDPEWNQASLLDLGRLAYEQLEKGNLIFYEKDLKECGIDVEEAAVRSGIFTQMFQEVSGVILGKVYSFVHLSIQEYLAALYVFLMMRIQGKDLVSIKQPQVSNLWFKRMLSPNMQTSMTTMQKSAVDKAFQCEDGRFDLFLRFLLGLSLDSNQNRLHGLLQNQHLQTDNEETIRYIKGRISEAPSSERVINLFHCLNELNDHSLVKEIQSFLSAGTLSKSQLSPGQWSALVFVLLTSEDKLDVFDLKKYGKSDEGLVRLLPVLEESQTALLNHCNLTKQSCAALASVLRKPSSKLKSLDLSGNKIGDIEVGEICNGLKNSICTLEMLNLSSCSFGEEGFRALASALRSNPSHMRELKLSGNKAENSGVKQLSSLLEDPNCKLEKLHLSSCSFGEEGFRALASALISNPSHMRELQLKGNAAGDSGVKHLSSLLRDPNCKLQKLEFGEEGFRALASALRSNPSHMRELQLSRSKAGDSGVTHLSSLLEDPNCKLDKLQQAHQERPPSPACTCLSMKSDKSLDRIITFPHGDPIETSRQVHQKRPPSPASTCLSMKSNKSQNRHITFQHGDPKETSSKMEDNISHAASSQSTQIPQCNLDHMLQELENKIFAYLRNELKRYKRILNPDYIEKSEHKDDEDDSDAREGALKMALHFLRGMDQKELAEKLQENEKDVVCRIELKKSLQNRYQTVFEGIQMQGGSALLEKIYTEVYITEGGSGKVNEEHEIRQIEMKSKLSAGQETPIKCSDIFKLLPGQDKPIRRVITKGVAGIGKTVSVQKYILDWAEGKENQDIHFIFPIPFREINLIREKQYSMMALLHHLFSEIKPLTFQSQEKGKVLFILDGLDECQPQLNFQRSHSLTDVAEVTSVDMLLTNLITGHLFPTALVWITSRPAAANQIPPVCVDRVTEVQGFSDPQKEEYFRKRISDQNVAKRVISHLRSSRSLYIMCHIPVFCWIAATVLQQVIARGEKVPKTLTEMYTYFLVFQNRQRGLKFDDVYDADPQWNQASLLDLGRLAYEQLEKGNLIFYEKHLKECGIDVEEAAVRSGIFTQMFQEVSGVILGKVYSFVHLSIQEYLAALYPSRRYVFLMMKNERKNIVSIEQPQASNLWLERMFPSKMQESMTAMQKSAVDKAFQCEDGRFDLFLRFLLGLSLYPNQNRLHGLLQNQHIQTDNEETIRYIKGRIREAPSSERVINLFHCLNELNDHSLVEEIQSFLSAGTLSEVQLSPGQWSALVFALLTSEDKLDVFDLKKYGKSDEGLVRLLPVLEESQTALLNDCNLTKESCVALASVLRKPSSKLKSLDLSSNNIGAIEVGEICNGLKNSICTLEMIKMLLFVPMSSWPPYYCLKATKKMMVLFSLYSLSSCSFGEEGFRALASALRSNPSHMRELQLSGNKAGDSGVKHLSSLLEDPNCKLEKLDLHYCNFGEEGFRALASALRSNPSHMRELQLSRNKAGDSGVKHLSSLLEDPNCKLEKLGFGEEGFRALASALRSNPSHMRELQLSWNRAGDSGVKHLSSLLEDPNCKLEKLDLSNCRFRDEGFRALASALRSNPSHMRELQLSGNIAGNSGVKHLSSLLENRYCKLEKLHIREEGFRALASALRSNPSHMRELQLSENKAGDSGVKHLSSLLEDPNCKLEKLDLHSCSFGEEGFRALASALRSNPSHMRELQLSENQAGDSGVKHLSSLLEDPSCKLEKLHLSSCSFGEEGFRALASALRSNPSHMRELQLSGNKAGDSGVKHLSSLLEDPNCKLEKLHLYNCFIGQEGFRALASALRSNPSHMRELQLSGNIAGDSGVKHLSSLLEDPNCKLEKLHHQVGLHASGSDLQDCIPPFQPVSYSPSPRETFIPQTSRISAGADVARALSRCPAPSRLLSGSRRLFTFTTSASPVLHLFERARRRFLPMQQARFGAYSVARLHRLKTASVPRRSTASVACSASTATVAGSLLSCRLGFADSAPDTGITAEAPAPTRPLSGSQPQPSIHSSAQGSARPGKPQTAPHHGRVARGLPGSPEMRLSVPSPGLHFGRHVRPSVFGLLRRSEFTSGGASFNPLVHPRVCDLRVIDADSIRHIVKFSISDQPGQSHAVLIYTVASHLQPYQILPRYIAYPGADNQTLGRWSSDTYQLYIRSHPSELRTAQMALCSLHSCSFGEEGFRALASALRSNPSHMRELLLSLNQAGNSGVKHLSSLLEDPNSKLEKLHFGEEGFRALASALRSNPSHMRELQLRGNKAGDSGVKHLSSLLEDPNCKLEKLQQVHQKRPPSPASTCLSMKSDKSQDRGINFQHGDRKETSKQVSEERPPSPASTRLSMKSDESLDRIITFQHGDPKETSRPVEAAGLERTGFRALDSALRSNPSHKRELQLKLNQAGDSGVKASFFSSGRITTVNWRKLDFGEEGFRALASALRSNPSHMRELQLSGNKAGDSGVKHLSSLLEDPNCKLEKLHLHYCSFGEEGFRTLASALRSNPSHMRELQLSGNQAGDSGVKHLSSLLEDPNCKLEKLDLNSCGIKDEGFRCLASALRSNPSHMRELQLSGNKAGDSGVKHLSSLLEDPNCKLEKLE
ncbi:uncharacterized protein LOC134466144 [Engraulis encrasicolus]|uniref:uncharacterized protein LOC134466144 n=1 Tax=Engraulis encrasicolus TaxID=184585 RepID=UPI002FCF8C4F